MSAVPSIRSDRGWRAALRLGFSRRGARSVLSDRTRSGPLSVQRPFYPEGDVCHVYVLHPPGGVVGGDSLDIEVRMAMQTHALLTTPGATKFYRSAGESARQTQRFKVQSGATLEWLPQENILFPGARAELRTEVELSGDACLVLWEILCLGRPAINEGFDSGQVDSRLSITRDGMPLLIDRLRAGPESRHRRSLMAGHAVTGTCVISGASESHLGVCRALLSATDEPHSAATLLDDLLVVRSLGDSTERIRRLFGEIWQALRQDLLGCPPSVPRIWST